MILYPMVNVLRAAGDAAGWILKEGGLDCGSKTHSASLS